MRKLAGIALLLVVLFGVQTLLAGTKGNGPSCKGAKFCTIEPDYIPSCPPCQHWEYCGPQCGCNPIPGCKP